jgi:hypothetical protein
MTAPAPTLEVDQTVALQRWLDTEPSVWPEGTYRSDGTLFVRAPISAPNVTVRRVGPPVRPPGAEKWDPRNASHVRVDADDVTIEGLRVTGTNTTGVFVVTLEAQHAFVVNGTSGTRLIGCRGETVHGDWVYAGAGPGAVFTTDLLIEGGGGTLIGRQGIGLTGVAGMTATGFELSGVARSGVDLEPSRVGGCVDVHIHAGKFKRCKGRNVGNGTGLGVVGNIVVEGNDFDAQFGVQFSPPDTGNRRFDITIVDNVSHGTSPGIRLQNIDGLTFTGNTVTWQSKRFDGIQGLDTCTDRHVHQTAPAGMPAYDIDDLA